MTKKIPEIRFTGFDGEWEEKIYDDILDKFDYGLNAPSKKFDGYNKYLRITDIDDSSRQFINDDLVSPDIELIDKESYLLNEGDIVFARTGASVGKTYRYRLEDGKVYYAGYLIRTTCKSENDCKFIFYSTLTNRFNKFIKITSQRSGQPGINAKEYSNYKIKVPLIEEQEKIGELFETLDACLGDQAAYVETLKKSKKAFLQKLFPKKGAKVPELRFPGFEGDWEKTRLKDILIETNEKTTINNQYEILSSTNTGLFKQKEYFNNQIASKNNIGYKILRKNQLVLSPQNLWMGNININNKYDIGIVSPSYKIFDIKKLFDINVIDNLLKTKRMYYNYKMASEQGASVVRRNLNIDDFLDIKILLPTLAEQEKIGTFFKALDEKIEKEEDKLESFERLKTALLQKVFV